MLPEIRQKYPYIYSVAKKSAEALEKNFNIQVSASEVGFIAMHLGAAMERLRAVDAKTTRALVVCGGGYATAFMLVSRIQAEFSEINVLEVCSVLELTNEKLLSIDPDIIISTISLQNISVPNIIVNPLLTEDDKEKIQEFLDCSQAPYEISAPQNVISGFSITSLLTEKTIQTQVVTENWEDAVEKACVPLLENQSIEPKYVDGIIDLLKRHGPYMVLAKGIILSPSMIGFGVNRLCMGLTSV